MKNNNLKTTKNTGKSKALFDNGNIIIYPDKIAGIKNTSKGKGKGKGKGKAKPLFDHLEEGGERK